jgi:DNA repair exonuclease SbcCD ATPase subunit
MKVRDVQSMDLADIRSEIELIEAEARRMAPSEAEFRRRFPTMAGRLQNLVDQRDRLERGEEAEVTPRPAPERPAPRIVGPTRRPASFLDLREELLEDDEAAKPARPASGASAAKTEGDPTKQLATRDAEIRRLREERDDWRGKAEGAESRLVRGAEMARRLDEALAELDVLRERLAELDRGGGEAKQDETAALEAEVEQLRNEQETMQATHHEEIERLRDRHRQEIESYLAQRSERERLEERITALEAELEQRRGDAEQERAASDQAHGEAEQARSEAERARAELEEARGETDKLRAELASAAERASEDAAAETARHEERLAELRDELADAQRRRAQDVARVEDDLEAVRAANVVATAERERLVSQLEAATLDRSVVTIGILQVVQGLASRIQDEPRFQALSSADPASEEVRRSLFQDLERFTADARSIGTDMGPEAFLHALSERLDAVPGWIGTLIDALGRATEHARDALAERETGLEVARSEAAASSDRASLLEIELATLRTAAEASAAEGARQAADAATKLGAVETELASARGEVERAESDRRALEARAADAEGRAERDAGEVQRLEEALEGSERHVAELENELSSSRHAHDAAKARIDELSIALESERLRASEADRQLEQHASELGEARARLGALQSAVDRAAHALADVSASS